jgi:hypothetical protein
MTHYIDGQPVDTIGSNGPKDYKESVRAATTTEIRLHGLQTIDGIELSRNNRILVKNQSNQRENGIYVVSEDDWKRSNDANSNNNITSGMMVYVSQGETCSHKVWILTSPDPIYVGTSDLLFQQYQSGGAESDPVFLSSEASLLVSGDKIRIDDAVQVGDDIVVLNNSVGYLSSLIESNVSDLVNDIGYLTNITGVACDRLRNTTTDATQTELFLDGASTRIAMPDNASRVFTTVFLARMEEGPDSAAFKIEGMIICNNGVIPPPDYHKTILAMTAGAQTDPPWDVSVEADNENKALKLLVTGRDYTVINWVARTTSMDILD